MAKTAKSYMIPVYAALVKRQVRDIEYLPEEYVAPVAEYLATKEGDTTPPASSDSGKAASSSSGSTTDSSATSASNTTPSTGSDTTSSTK
ncbi:MAG TPA: CD1375 family protein [Ruminiclostridium sp.]|nr:CD1375 family protein [Ruminiclostridium sp.]